MPKFEKVAELMDYQAQAAVEQYNLGRFPVEGFAVPLIDGYYILAENGKYYLVQRLNTKSEVKIQRKLGLAAA